ncbi:hypothetical protein KIPB_013202 [Kipferlia bialata]|uniref:Uncharacterized protein n=1 Tax=Kipferlia bialata TaxID=797122 RepID=A0A9K3DAT2_9EUKA|nr:hypothetical protein KIPB_013202 [Kipferlia bialata]|eukprot:g13202.t1
MKGLRNVTDMKGLRWRCDRCQGVFDWVYASTCVSQHNKAGCAEVQRVEEAAEREREEEDKMTKVVKSRQIDDRLVEVRYDTSYRVTDTKRVLWYDISRDYCMERERERERGTLRRVVYSLSPPM